MYRVYIYIYIYIYIQLLIIIYILVNNITTANDVIISQPRGNTHYERKQYTQVKNSDKIFIFANKS